MYNTLEMVISVIIGIGGLIGMTYLLNRQYKEGRRASDTWSYIVTRGANKRSKKH